MDAIFVPVPVDPISNAGQSSQTYAHQDSLPSLPIPSLQPTLVKLAKSARALKKDDAEFQDFQRVLHEFGQGEGLEYQEMFEAFAAGKRNWLEEIWREWAYLRWPDTIQPQEGIAYKHVNLLSQSERAAKTLVGALYFKTLLDRGMFPPLTGSDGSPLCMQQYSRLNGQCRVPGASCDTQRFYPDSRHIVIICRSNFFALNVFDEHGKLIKESELKRIIGELVRTSLPPQHEYQRVAALTAWERPRWAAARKIMEENPTNQKILSIVDSCLCFVSLDDASPEGRSEILRHTMAPREGGSRWHDKGIQWVFYSNGESGGGLEHSAVDGAPSIHMTEIADDFEQRGGVEKIEPAIFSSERFSPVKLEWDLSDEKLRSLVVDAHRYSKVMANTLDAETAEISGYGKDAIKKYGLSPDAFVQIAMQLAFLRTYGELVAVYETVGLTRYYHGRTETGRSVSEESVAFVSAMANDGVSTGDKIELLRKACAQHVTYCSEAAKGQGIDRHLLALRLMAGQKSREPALFRHPLYLRSSNFVLTSSQLYGPNKSWAIGFRAVIVEGTGVQYQLLPEALRLCVFSDNRCSKTNSAKYLRHVVDALSEMHGLFSGKQSKL